jgi:hypothetical protein
MTTEKIMRITPETINSLNPNEIFVFGSNITGIHGAGAAKLAREKFGAKQWVGIGPTGRCYAIPTRYTDTLPNGRLQFKTLPLTSIFSHIADFIEYSKIHLEQIFLVTAIGCGFAGYKASEIAPAFNEALYLNNVYLPKLFYEYI